MALWCSVLGVVTVVYFVKRMQRPFENLVQATAAIARGNYEQRGPDESNDGFSQIARQLGSVAVKPDPARVQSAEGYRIGIASDGHHALALARSEKFSVVLLNVMLPKMSGIEVCQQLEADKNSVPVLMLTAMGMVQDRITGLRCGADH